MVLWRLLFIVTICEPVVSVSGSAMRACGGSRHEAAMAVLETLTGVESSECFAAALSWMIVDAVPVVPGVVRSGTCADQRRKREIELDPDYIGGLAVFDSSH
jgi:hypothetical protein